MTTATASSAAHRTPFYTLLVLVTIIFLTGGGSRADIQSLIFLRPLAFLGLAVGLIYWSREHGRPFTIPLVLLCLSAALAATHLIPLPASLWQALPGRYLVRAIDHRTGIGDIARPLSLAPTGTLNALYSLVVPAAVLILGVAVTSRQREKLLLLLIVLGMLSGLLGVLQVMGPPDGPLYLYRITSSGQAVGLFANRNHNAVFLSTILPMLALYAADTGTRGRSSSRSHRGDIHQQLILRKILALACAALLVPMILVTGSRAGLVAGACTLISTPIVYRLARPAKDHSDAPTLRRWPYIAAGTGLVALILLVILLSRAESFDRLMTLDAAEDLRAPIWQISATLSAKYFPAGSGLGSFVPVFKVAEPHDMLQASYINHVHNDWIELALTGGLPAILLLVSGLAAWLWRAALSLRQRHDNGRQPFALVGLIVSLVLMLSSIVDYPLRTPSMMALFIIAMLWLFEDRSRAVYGTGKPDR